MRKGVFVGLIVLGIMTMANQGRAAVGGNITAIEIAKRKATLARAPIPANRPTGIVLPGTNDVVPIAWANTPPVRRIIDSNGVAMYGNVDTNGNVVQENGNVIGGQFKSTYPLLSGNLVGSDLIDRDSHGNLWASSETYSGAVILDNDALLGLTTYAALKGINLFNPSTPLSATMYMPAYITQIDGVWEICGHTIPEVPGYCLRYGQGWSYTPLSLGGPPAFGNNVADMGLSIWAPWAGDSKASPYPPGATRQYGQFSQQYSFDQWIGNVAFNPVVNSQAILPGQQVFISTSRGIIQAVVNDFKSSITMEYNSGVPGGADFHTGAIAWQVSGGMFLGRYVAVTTTLGDFLPGDAGANMYIQTRQSNTAEACFAPVGRYLGGPQYGSFQSVDHKDWFEFYHPNIYRAIQNATGGRIMQPTGSCYVTYPL